MPLPWQHTFYHCQKMCLAHLHPMANICAKFDENWWKNWGSSSHDARFSPHFLPRQYAVTMATHFLPLSKNVSCTSTPQRQTSVPNFMRIGEKTEEVVRDARFSPNFCHNMPLPWQHTFYHCQKMCLARSTTPRQRSVPKFHENWWKTEEVVRDARFFPHFCHNMPLPWQHTFYHCQKNVSCTSTPQGKHLCQISWELMKKLRK